MITLEGQYYDGRQPIAHPARMFFTEIEATISIEQGSEHYSMSRLKVSPRIGRSDRFVVLPDSTQFQCNDHPFLDSLPQESRSEGLVAWLEKRWIVALACVAAVIGILLAGYFYALPYAAERIAVQIPMTMEQELGKQALDWLDNKGWFEPTGLDEVMQEELQEGFEKLCSDRALRDFYRLEFRNSSLIGPNAITLPGGTIVITDDMVDLALTTEEVLSVLAHEIGHVELRHTMRSVLQNSAVALLATAVTSDAASLSVAVAGLPALLVQTKYSRQFEDEADAYAFSLLQQKNLQPAAFAAIIERLSAGDRAGELMPSYLSSHPATAERIRRARESIWQNLDYIK